MAAVDDPAAEALPRELGEVSVDGRRRDGAPPLGAGAGAAGGDRPRAGRPRPFSQDEPGRPARGRPTPRSSPTSPTRRGATGPRGGATPTAARRQTPHPDLRDPRRRPAAGAAGRAGRRTGPCEDPTNLICAILKGKPVATVSPQRPKPAVRLRRPARQKHGNPAGTTTVARATGQPPHGAPEHTQHDLLHAPAPQSERRGVERAGAGGRECARPGTQTLRATKSGPRLSSHVRATHGVAASCRLQPVRSPHEHTPRRLAGIGGAARSSSRE